MVDVLDEDRYSASRDAEGECLHQRKSDCEKTSHVERQRVHQKNTMGMGCRDTLREMLSIKRRATGSCQDLLIEYVCIRE